MPSSVRFAYKWEVLGMCRDAQGGQVTVGLKENIKLSRMTG
jgi:hypothetical protein